jgi:hypothetical protein
VGYIEELEEKANEYNNLEKEYQKLAERDAMHVKNRQLVDNKLRDEAALVLLSSGDLSLKACWSMANDFVQTRNELFGDV